jgi:hypothetical protein
MTNTLRETKKAIRTKIGISIIVLLIISIGFLAKNINFTDGIGFARGREDGGMYFGLAKQAMKNGHLIDSMFWMSLSSKLTIDSEIKWNKAQPYIKQYNGLVKQGKLKEALDVCVKIDELIRKYDWDYGILYDCYLLNQQLNQVEA